MFKMALWMTASGLRSLLLLLVVFVFLAFCSPDELLLLTHKNSDLSTSAALYFTETWLSEHTPDSALVLPGFQLF